MTLAAESPAFAAPPDTDALIWVDGKPRLDLANATVADIQAYGAWQQSKWRFQSFDAFEQAVAEATTAGALRLLLREVTWQRVVCNEPDGMLSRMVYARAKTLGIWLRGASFRWDGKD